MTSEEAIALRTDQLAGKPVDQFRLAIAMRVIRLTRARTPRTMHRGRLPDRLLKLLTAGPVERSEFYKRASAEGRPLAAMQRLRDKGLIVCEVRLTQAGLEALGLVGPDTKEKTK